MSCDWFIRCVDCGEDGGISSEDNHQDELVRCLIRRAGDVAALGSLLADAEVRGSAVYDVTLHVSSVLLDLGFFVRHRGHRLRPVDEYGRFDVPCKQVVHCSKCNADLACEEMEGHCECPAHFAHGHWVGNEWHHCEAR